MKTATHDQIKDIAIRVLNLNPGKDKIDGDAIQKGLEGHSIEDVNRRITVFLNNGLSLVITKPDLFSIDRSTPFNPSKFIGKNWMIWHGPARGIGLKGKEEQDVRSLELTEIDPSKILFEHCLRGGERFITGEEKLIRHIISVGHICLDAKIGQCLLEEENQKTLEWFYWAYGISWLEFPGTVLRVREDGSRCFLCLCRDNCGTWIWDYLLLDILRNVENLSAILKNED